MTPFMEHLESSAVFVFSILGFAAFFSGSLENKVLWGFGLATIIAALGANTDVTRKRVRVVFIESDITAGVMARSMRG